MDALDVWCSNYTKLLYQHSNVLREKASECLRSLSTHVSDSDEFRGHMSPQRVMEIVTLTNALEQKACHDTDARRISDFFSRMDALLDEGSLDPGAAVAVLVALSTCCGVLLPFFRGSEDAGSGLSSTVSLHAVRDEAEEANERLWAKLSARLSRALVDRLADADVAAANAALDEGGVEQLLLLSSPGAAWLSYKQLRTRQLDRLAQLTFRGGGESAQQLLAMPAQWRQYAAAVRAMVETDVRLLPLFGVGNALDALVNLYLDFVCEEVRAFAAAVDALLLAPGQDRRPPAGTNPRGRARRRVGPAAAPGEPEELGVEPLLLVVDTLASWCQLEAHLLAIVNDFWSRDTIGVDLEAGAQLGFATGVAAPAQKPKGVLKKLRRNSRRPSAHLAGGADDRPLLPLVDPGRAPSESPQVQEGSAAIQPYLEWQAELEPAFPALAAAVEAHLGALWAAVSLTDTAATASNSFGLKQCSPQESPRLVSAALWDYLHLAERLVPLVAEGCQTEEGGAEAQLLAAFTHTLGEHLGSARAAAHELLANGDASVEALVQAAANVQCLQDFCFRLGLLFMAKDEASGSSFWDWRKRLAEAAVALGEAVERTWTAQLLASTLQDAESHHWADGKEFYEDERASLALQFWRLALARLWHRLSGACSPDLARQVLRGALLASVRLLRQRYLCAQPQPRRLQQFRADILAILQVTEDFLCRSTTDLEQLLGVDSDIFSSSRAIHAEMMGLLHVLVVVASPLSDFYAVHRKGFYRSVASSDLSEENSFRAGFWLGLVDPELYANCLKASSVRDMLATNAICAQLRLLCAAPVPHLGMVLRVLSMCEAALSVLVVSQAPPGQARDLYAALFRVFAHLPSLAPGKLARLVLAALKSCGDASALTDVQKAARGDVPAFVDALLLLLEPYTEKAAASLRLLARRPELDLGAWFERLGIAGSLPCGCRFEVAHAGAMRAAAVGAELAAVAEALAAELFALPEPLRHALAALQARLDEGPGHVALRLLLLALLRRVRSRAKDEGIAATAVTAVWSALRQRAEELPALQDVVALSLSGILLDDGVDYSPVPDGADYEALRQRQALATALRDAAAQPAVSEDLRFLYFFLKRNEAWVRANMGFGSGEGPPMVLDVRAREASPKFHVGAAAKEFNPDSCRLTQVVDAPGAWSQLVACPRLGLSRAAFLALTPHRPDFLTDAFLDERQRAQVSELRDKFRL